jgi:hypothetical protein
MSLARELVASLVNGWCRWSACSARGQQEADGEPELVALPVPTDSEAHRVHVAVTGAAAQSERRVVPQVEPVAAAECVPPVVLRSRVARWGARHGLRPRLVQALVLLRHVAAMREYGPQDWAARQAAFARGSVEPARLVAVVSRAEELVRLEPLPGAARARDRQWAAGGPLPGFADGRDSPRRIVRGWLRPAAYVAPAQEPALCAAHAVPPVRRAWVER